MRFYVEPSRYSRLRPGATAQQFWIAEGGPRNGVASSLPATIPNRLTGYVGGSYAATGERNAKHQHIYLWEPTP